MAQQLRSGHIRLLIFLLVLSLVATMLLLAGSHRSSNHIHLQLDVADRLLRKEYINATTKVEFTSKTQKKTTTTTTLQQQQSGLLTVNETLFDRPFATGVTNPHNFSWLILEKDVCTGKRQRPLMLIIVHSAPKNFKRRMFIRDTWGSSRLCSKLNIVVVFALGAFRDNQTQRDQKTVVRENSVYRDIIQESFVDSYRNLTLKSVMWLRWVTFYCPQTRFVLKLDDDIFVNTFTLVRHVENMHKRGIASENTVACNVWNNMPVQRDTNSKWFVAKNDFTAEYFPTYCSGSAYLISGDLVPRLYWASFDVSFFWVDDYWLTGSVASHVNATRHEMGSVFALGITDRFIYEESFLGGYIVFGHVPHIPMREKHRVWRTIAARNDFRPMP